MNTSPLYNEFEAFDAEIQEVQSTLLAATTDLTSPLGDLVRAQIKRSQPPICAAVVLAVSKPQEGERSQQGNGDLRRKRILLAAALEMLHVALNVHRLLVNAARLEQKDGQQGHSEPALDRAFIGSTILAGDYCFSRAAQMAAQTDHARVVATFALALQTVSEGLLREQFDPSDSTGDGPVDENGNYDETRQLLRSGAYASALLIDLPKNEEQEAIALSQEIASRWRLQLQGLPIGASQPQDSRTETLPANWQVLHLWYNHQRANGEGFPSSPKSAQKQYR
jgi:hypothetical protein